MKLITILDWVWVLTILGAIGTMFVALIVLVTL